MMTKHSLRAAALVAAFFMPAAAFAAGASTKNSSTVITGSLPPFASTPSFSIAGSLPAFASTPTFNCGNCSSGGGGAITGPLGASTTAANSVSVVFGSGSTLPAFAATPAFTLSGTAAVTGTFWQATQPVSIASMPTTPVTGTFWQTTQPVSIASIPLAATAPTLSNQALMVTALQNLDAGVPAALGQTTMAASMPVVISSNQSAVPVSGTVGLSGTLPAFAATPTFNCGTGCSGGSNASVGANGTTAATSSTQAGGIITNGARTLTAGQQTGLPIDSTVDGVRVTLVGGQAASSAAGTPVGGSNYPNVQGCGPAPITSCLPVETSAGPNALVTITPTVTASAYTSGMSVGGLQTFPIFRSTGKPSAILTSFTSLGTTAAWATQTMNVYLYTAVPTGACTDHTAFTWNASDAGIMVPGSPFSIAMVAGNVATTPVMATQQLAQSVASSSGTVNIYACVIVTGTPTPTVGSLRYTLGAVQD